MKKYLILLLFVFSLFTVLAQNEAFADEDSTPVISVAGSSFDNYSPDTAVAIFAVETKDKDVVKASNLNTQKSNVVISALKNMLNTKRGDSIKTSNYSVYPIYETNPKTNRGELAGYQVVNMVMVRTKDINSVGNLISTAVKNGANRVEGVNFLIENDEKYCSELLSKASKNARLQANSIATALGVKISGVRKVSSSCNSSFMQPVYDRAYASKMSMAMAESTPSIEPGDIKLQANVNIDFDIVNP